MLQRNHPSSAREAALRRFNEWDADKQLRIAETHRALLRVSSKPDDKAYHRAMLVRHLALADISVRSMRVSQ